VLCPPPDALPSEDVDGDSSSDSRSSSSSSDKQNQPLAKRAESKGKSKGGCQLRTSRGWDGARGEHWASDGYSGYRYSNEGDVRETPEGEVRGLESEAMVLRLLQIDAGTCCPTRTKQTGGKLATVLCSMVCCVTSYMLA